MRLSDLPSEVLLRILRHLPLSSLLALRGSCSYFREVTRDKFVWRMLARRDYGVVVSCSQPRELYQNFYHKYGRMLGLYRLYTFFSKHLLQVTLDPNNSRQIVFRTWPLESGAGVPRQRDVLSISIDKNQEVSAQCLETHHEDNQTFCFNDHSGDKPHFFHFHHCKHNLYFSPLKGDLFNTTFCPDERCLVPDFTQVVCCQGLTELEGPVAQRVIKPGIFVRYPHNRTSNTAASESFFTLHYLTDPISSPYLSLSSLSSHHAICCTSLLMSCDLANVRRSVLTIETPNYDVDEMAGRPFSWAQDIEQAGGLKWPKSYKAAYFDGSNMVFLVLFDSEMIGCFFQDGTCDMFHRFHFN